MRVAASVPARETALFERTLTTAVPLSARQKWWCTSSISLSQQRSTQSTRAENAFVEERLSRLGFGFILAGAFIVLILVRAVEFI